MIAEAPLADNTDVYSFKIPDDPNKIIVIANYTPFQAAQVGLNHFHFSEDIRNEIHIDDNINTMGDDILYGFNFKRLNEDPATF